MLKKIFLYRVLKKDKPLFIVFALFICFQFFFIYKHVENTPFFHFGMYSAIHAPQTDYTVYAIIIDTTHVRSLDFPDYQREVVYNTIALYDGLKQMNYYDSLDRVISKRFSADIAARARIALLDNEKMDTPYQKWLFQYIADMRMVKTPVIELDKQKVHYRPDGTLTTIGPMEQLFKLRDE